MSRNLSITDNIQIIETDIFGNELRRIHVHNLITSTGLDIFRDYLAGTLLAPNYFMLGTGTTAAASTDTALQSSNFDVAFTDSTTRSAGITFNGYVYSTDGVGSTWNEVGIFTSSSQLIGRALITPIIKTSSSPTNQLIAWAFDLTAATRGINIWHTLQTHI